MQNPIDVHVGKRIRRRRWLEGMSQQQLAEKVGVKFQQIQKYETAMNRVSASRLWNISEAQGVSVAYYFMGVHDDEAELDNSSEEDLNNEALVKEKEAFSLLRSYFSIPDSQRRRLLDLAHALGKLD